MGIEKLSKLVQLLKPKYKNCESPISVGNEILANFEQPLNTEGLILVTPLGIEISSKFEHSLNAPHPILVKELGIVMLFKLAQPLNAPLPILVMPSLSSIWTIETLPEGSALYFSHGHSPSSCISPVPLIVSVPESSNDQVRLSPCFPHSPEATTVAAAAVPGNRVSVRHNANNPANIFFFINSHTFP